MEKEYGEIEAYCKKCIKWVKIKNQEPIILKGRSVIKGECPKCRMPLFGTPMSKVAVDTLIKSGYDPGWLTLMLRHWDNDASLAAAYALEAIGTDARAAVPSLIEMLHDEDNIPSQETIRHKEKRHKFSVCASLSLGSGG